MNEWNTWQVYVINLISLWSSQNQSKQKYDSVIQVLSLRQNKLFTLMLHRSDVILKSNKENSSVQRYCLTCYKHKLKFKKYIQLITSEVACWTHQKVIMPYQYLIVKSWLFSTFQGRWGWDTPPWFASERVAIYL